MNLFSFLSAWVTIIYLYFGFNVLKINPKAKLNRLFMLWAICMAVFSFCFSFLYSANDIQSQRFWYKLSALGWAAHIGILLQIALLITNNTKFLKKIWLIPIYGPGILVALFELFYGSVAQAFPEFAAVFVVSEDFYIFIYAFLSIAIIWRWGKKTLLRREKKQAHIFVCGGLVAAALSITNEIIHHLFYIKAIPSINQIILLLYAIAIWYAIIEYKLPGLVSLIKMDEIINKVTDLVFMIDKDGKVVDYNQKVSEKLDYSKKELLGCPLNRVIGEKINDILTAINQTECICYDSGIYCAKKSGDLLPVSLHISAIKDKSGDQVGALLVCQDRSLIEVLRSEINNRIYKEQQLKYLGSHDSITGLYNRNWFEQELINLEKQNSLNVGVMICDIDGLKLANDTLGHNAGDQLLTAAARAIQAAFHGNEIVARIGGDEFGILSPGGGVSLFENAYRDIQKEVRQFNRKNSGLHLSISIGYAVANGKTRKITDLFKEADNNMYKEKLNHISSTHNGIIQALLKTMEVRDFVTEGHTQRIESIALELGGRLRLAEPVITNLVLLSQFHDIGKIGIPDKILFKTGPLTLAEMEEMQKHCEIGFRIAKSIQELNSIANLILRHHERWDGKGYPLGLEGEAIPLECRVLSVIDTFDVMTHDRPYRRAMAVKDAVTELRQNSGTQFDPRVISEFIKLLQT